MSGQAEIAAEHRLTCWDHVRGRWYYSWSECLRAIRGYSIDLYGMLAAKGDAAQDFWIAREVLRINSEQYKPLQGHPLLLPMRTPEHALLFAHVSLHDSMNVAYTPNAQYGRNDRQVVTTLGRFLTRFYAPYYSEAEIRDLTTIWRDYWGTDDIKWARTADEIHDVYMRSATESCMSHSAEHYPTGGTHPVRAYAGPDTCLAYLEREGRVVSRTVVYEPRKYWVRIFGDDLLRVKLEALGYQNGSLEGAKVLRIPFRNGFIAPYIDGSAQAVCEIFGDDKHLLVCCEGGPGAMTTQSTGFAVPADADEDDDSVTCGECDAGGLDPNDVHYSDWLGHNVCDDCYERYYVVGLVQPQGQRQPYEDTLRQGDCTYYNGLAEYVFDQHASRILEARNHFVLSSEYYEDPTTAHSDEVCTDAHGEVILMDDAFDTPQGETRHRDEVIKFKSGHGVLWIHESDDLSDFFIEAETGALVYEDDVSDADSPTFIRVRQWLFWMLCFMPKLEVLAIIKGKWDRDDRRQLIVRALESVIEEHPELKAGPVQANIFLEREAA
ncbi:MAG: hypothetical protein ACXWCW_28690 [Burkholderiales bacterium]